MTSKIGGNKFLKVKEDDEYETPPAIVEMMLQLSGRPVMDVVWEPFCGPTLQSVHAMEGAGYTVVYNPDQDFFALNQAPPEANFIVTNPPFTRKVDACMRLCQMGLPFVMLIPVGMIQQKCFVKNVARIWGHDMQVIYPPGKVHFWKDGKQYGRNPFDVAFLCYRCPLRHCAWIIE